MLSNKVKKEISDLIQDFLQEVDDKELPEGEISFILHVDGAQGWSWANIRNESDVHKPAPLAMQRNFKEISKFKDGV